MSGASRRGGRTRGEPLLVLVLIVGDWFAMRVLLWQPPFGITRSGGIMAPAPALKTERAAIQPGPDARPAKASLDVVPGPEMRR